MENWIAIWENWTFGVDTWTLMLESRPEKGIDADVKLTSIHFYLCGGLSEGPKSQSAPLEWKKLELMFTI